MKFPFIDLKTQYNSSKESIDKAIQKVLEHGQYIMGPEVIQLEETLSEYIGVKHTLACSSGTDALILPLLAQNIGQGDAVFTTPFTFFASAEAISLCGATPIFVDIDPRTYNIDPGKLEEKINDTERYLGLVPKAILSVDLFGLSADYNRISKIADKNGLFLIEDAAQAFGAPYFGKKACSLGNVGATSFYPAKPLGCYGDGGAIFTDNTETYETMKSIRVHGQAINEDKYDNVRIGLNARMDTIQAAVLLNKLKFYDKELELRNKVAQRYTESLKNAVICPYLPEGQGSVWAQYSIQVTDRDGVKKSLAEKGIPTAVFYPIPIHLSKAYEHLGYKEGDLPISEATSKKIISLPMHPYLTNEQIDEISEAVIASVE